MTERARLNFIEKIILALLFLFAISLFNLAGYILAGIFIAWFFITLNRKHVLDKAFLALLLFSVAYFLTYALFWPVGVKEVIIYLIAPWGCYLLGQELIAFSKDDRMLYKMTFVLAAGFFAHGVLNFYAYVTTYGVDSPYRVTVDYWRNDILSVTGCSLYYVPLMSLAIGYLFYGQKRLWKLASLAVISVGVMVNVVYSNRTAMYLVAILTVLGVATSLFRKNASPKTWLTILFILALVSFAWTTDIMGFRSVILDLNVTKRIVGSDVGRFSVWRDFLTSDWWSHPLGGDRVVLQYGYAHNLWLDTLRTVGFAPFFLLIGFSFMAFFSVSKFYKSAEDGQKPYVYLILGTTISCAVEPIIASNPYYFLMLLMIIGGIKGIFRKQRTGCLWMLD